MTVFLIPDDLGALFALLSVWEELSSTGMTCATFQRDDFPCPGVAWRGMRLQGFGVPQDGCQSRALADYPDVFFRSNFVPIEDIFPSNSRLRRKGMDEATDTLDGWTRVDPHCDEENV
jgi:hypothetical protein